MPKVPTYPVGQVQNTPLQGPHATAASFGAGNAELLTEAGRAGTRLGAAFGQVADDQQGEDDRLAVRDVLNKAKTEARDYLNGSVYNLQGRDALDAVTTAQQELPKIGERHEKLLRNDRQRQLFGIAYGDASYSYGDSLASFQRAETDRYKKATFEASLNNYVADSSANPFNKPLLEENEHNMTADVANMFKGMGSDVQNAQVRKHVSLMYGNAAATLADKNPAEALKFVEEYKEKFEPHIYADLKDKITERFQRASVETAAASLVHRNAPRAQAEAEAAKLTDSKQRELLLGEYDRKYAIKRDAQEAATRERINTTMVSLLKDPSGEIPADLPPAVQDSLRSMAKDKAAGVLRTDPEAYTKLIDMAAQKPQEFLRTDLTSYAGRLSPEDMRLMINTQFEIQKGAKPDKAFRVRRISEQLTAALDEKFKKEHPEKYQAYMGYMTGALGGIPDDQMTEERVQAEIKKALEPVQVTRKLFGFDALWPDKMVPRYQVEYDPDQFANLPSELKGVGAKRNPANLKEIIVPQRDGSWAVFNDDAKPVLNKDGRPKIYSRKK